MNTSAQIDNVPIRHGGKVYQGELRPGEDGWIVAEVKDLGAVTQGQSRAEAITNLREAVALAAEAQ